MRLRTLIFAATVALASQARSSSETTYAPILAYNPNLGGVYGAVVLRRDGSDFKGLQAMSTASGVMLGVLDWKQDLSGGLSLVTKHELSNFYELYYGEGNATRVQDQTRVDMRHYRGALSLRQSLGGALAMHVYGDWRAMQDQSGGLLSNESTASLGAGFSVDTRDNEFSPVSGALAKIQAAGHPGTDGTRAFAQAELELRAYQSVGPVVFAGRLNGAVSSGEPTYMYRYRLGGTDELRGYFGNRFRGKHKLSTQLEARFPIFMRVSGDVFADLGEATDSSLTRPHLGYGAGLRLALGDSGLMKARIDVGLGEDQNGVYVGFGHAF